MTKGHGRNLFWAALAVASLAAAVGALSSEAAPVAAAISVVGVAQVSADLRRRDGFGATTVWGASMAITGLADTVAVCVTDPVMRSAFFLYAAEEYLLEAELIGLLGSTALLLGLRFAKGARSSILLPAIRSDTNRRGVWTALAIGGVALLVMRINLIQIGGGTFATLYNNGVIVIVFAIARMAARRNDSGWLWLAACLAYAEAARAALFEILRGNMLLPLAALALGCLVGARSARVFRRPQLVPMYVALVAFVGLFKSFGESRTRIGYGMDRIEDMSSAKAEAGAGAITLLARLTSINQVSQVARIVATEGPEGGRTLEYYKYAFVPRLLWPGKPVIAKGQWFADRLGQGTWRSADTFSNSINMTVAGEWYLNFGWIGAALGSLIAGIWMGVLWRAAGLWSSGSRPLEGAYAFLTLYATWTLIVDMQVLVSATAVYAVFFALAEVLWRVMRIRPTRRVGVSGDGTSRVGVSASPVGAS